VTLDGDRLTFIPALPDHIAPIADRMREADRLEVLASSGKTPAEALAFSLSKSAASWTIIIDGRPEMMFGVADLNILTQVGSPWLLGTDVVHDHRSEFLRGSVRWREQLFERYDILRNFVDDRNTLSMRWLKWLGARFSEPMPIGVNGEMFRMFEMRRWDV